MVENLSQSGSILGLHLPFAHKGLLLGEISSHQQHGYALRKESGRVKTLNHRHTRILLSLLFFFYDAIWFMLLFQFFIPWLRIIPKWGTMYFDPAWLVLVYFTVGAYFMAYLFLWGLLLLFDK